MSAETAAAPAPVVPVRVLVVDDDPLVRSALSMVLSAAADVTVIGQAGDGDEAVSAAAATTPDVVLMDVRMPRRDGISATAEILAAARAAGAPGAMTAPDASGAVQVLVLTTFAEDEAVLAALRAGACGFLLKDTPPLQIVEAVRQAAAGETTISPSVVRRLVTRVLDDGPPAPVTAEAQRCERALRALGGLSQREHDVAVAVADGQTNAEIAQRLHLSAATVKAHLSRVMDKLGVSNRVQVAITVHDAHLR